MTEHEDQVTVADLLRRLGADPESATPRRRRRREDGGISVSDLTGEQPRISDVTPAPADADADRAAAPPPASSPDAAVIRETSAAPMPPTIPRSSWSGFPTQDRPSPTSPPPTAGSAPEPGSGFAPEPEVEDAEDGVEPAPDSVAALVMRRAAQAAGLVEDDRVVADEEILEIPVFARVLTSPIAAADLREDAEAAEAPVGVPDFEEYEEEVTPVDPSMHAWSGWSPTPGMPLLGDPTRTDEHHWDVRSFGERSDDEAGDETDHDEAGYDEVGYDETDHDDAGYDEAGYDEAGYDETDHDDAEYDETDHDDTGYDETEHDDAGFARDAGSPDGERDPDGPVPMRGSADADVDAEPSTLREWGSLAGQSVLALIAGAGLFLGFERLWAAESLRVLAFILAIIVVVLLVGVVRVLRRADDVFSMVLAVIVGLLVTVGPLVLLQ